MPRRSRYPAGKGSQQTKGRRSSSRGKPQVPRPSVPIASRPVTASRDILATPVSSDPVRQDYPPPPYITGELRRIAIIAGAMILILAILSLVI